MKKVLFRSLVLALGVALVSSAALAKSGNGGYGSYSRTSEANQIYGLDNYPNGAANRGGFASAVANTVTLGSWKFDSGSNCTAQSWTTVDINKQAGDYWHVDDFAGLGAAVADGPLYFVPTAGTKSLWLGVRAGPAFCGYGTTPGYGNNWNQAFCTKTCVSTAGAATADLDMSYSIKFSSEDQWDGCTMEYTTDCPAGNIGWTKFAGGTAGAGAYTGADSLTVSASYPLVNGLVKVRFKFTSDSNTSSEDSGWNGLSVIVDNLTIETLGPEDFEGEAVGAISSNDWTSCNTPGYGDFLALFKRTTGANHEDLCLDNLSCYWAAISGSAEFYTCGNPPQATQKIVPHMNLRGEYIKNEIWSPQIALGATTGNDIRLRFAVYRDLPLDNLIFYVWHIRTISGTGCASLWRDRQFVYYGDNKDWAIIDQPIGTVTTTVGATHIQVALGVEDMCPFWCGSTGSGVCHSPAPYFDSVKVLRVDTVGPAWDVRDLDTFNDNFAANGTTTGTARADMANDVRTASNPAIVPGDSSLVLYCVDPVYSAGPFYLNASGLLQDPTLSTFAGRNKGKRQMYCWVAVWPLGQPGKVGAPLSEGPGGTANRYPFSGTQVVNGVTWTKIRFDYTYTGTVSTAGIGLPGQARQDYRFNVDLNDNLFTPGDTVCFFYSATSAGGTTYFSNAWGATSSLTEIAANPTEFTILPAGGWARGGDILYVDGSDGGGHQNYFDGAFQVLGLLDKVDRFDVRSPSSGVSNRPSSRVTNIAVQLNGCYRKILWDCSNQSTTLGDGTGSYANTPEKTDDYSMLNTFLGNLTNNGGVYLCGDRVGQYLATYAGAGAVTFRTTYIPFTIPTSGTTSGDNHRLWPGVAQISPAVKRWPGRCFTDDAFVFGGCASLNDFDVFNPAGSSLIEMSYQTASDPDGAVISNVTGFAHVMLSGFGFGYLRDDETNGISDRAQHMHDIITWLGNTINQPTGAGPALKDELSQNYPNPFNPQTTIAFSIKDRGNVSLKVYNVAGQLVRTLANENRAAGPYTVVWDGRNDAGQPVSSGVYFYKLVANNFSQTKKMVLLK